MMTDLFRMEGDDVVLSFVRMFYRLFSEYLWDQNAGNVHAIPQGEGDVMMSLLFCLGKQEVL